MTKARDVLGAAALLLLTATTLGSCGPTGGEAVASTRLVGPLSAGEHEATLNGVNLWYRVAGNWDGRSAPVVFLAGGPGGNSFTFAEIAGPHLEPTQLMVYFDQRGTGRSERPASGDYALATLADDVEALRRHLGVPQIAIVAHSFGAIPALEYAAKYPSGTAALVLAGGLWNAAMSCREQAERIAELHPETYKTMIAGGQPSDADICESVFRAFRGDERERFNEENMFPDRATLDRLNASEQASGLKNTGELSSAVFRAGLLQYRFGAAEEVEVPVLVVSGERDYAAGPETQRALAAALPQGRLVEYEGRGHWMFIEDPVRFGRDVSAFLRSAQRR